jgi:hypothetical protein
MDRKESIDLPASADAAGSQAAMPAPANEPSKTRVGAVRRDVWRIAALFVGVLLASVLGYLAVALPGAWFASASPAAFGVRDLVLARGTGRVQGDELIVSAPDASGVTLITVTTNLRASDYHGVAWVAAGLREDAEVRLLWRSDVQPGKLNLLPVRVESGQTLLTTITPKDLGWIGHVTGLALAIQGPLPQPVTIRGVIAKPMGAWETLGDRFHEWFAFEAWNGTSINTVVGGADHQDVPLPATLAAVVAICVGVVLLLRRWRPRAFGAAVPAIVAALFISAWLALDVRWTWNLARQERATASQYAGKTPHEKLLASSDAPLVAFLDKVRAVLPATPVRVLIAANADYFRERAAYHLYPHSVYARPRSNELPDPTSLRAGDWVLVYQRPGVQFDQQHGKLRWDGHAPRDAELKLVEPGAALFVIR